MKLLWFGLLVLSTSAFGQRAGGFGGGARGFGMGGGAASAVHPRFGGVFVGPGFGFRVPGFGAHFGLPPLTPIPPLGGGQFRFRRGPFFSNGFGALGLTSFSPLWLPGYWSEETYPYTPEPNVIVVQPPPAAPYQAPAAPPPPKPAKPVINEYHFSAAEAAAPPVEERAYVIALKDGSRASATALWVEGRTLCYIDRDDNEHRVPLAEVDRPLTQKLNREQQLPLSLPGAVSSPGSGSRP